MARRRPVSSCACGEQREVCNHLLQLVESPLTSRVHSLDLGMRKRQALVESPILLWIPQQCGHRQALVVS
jgi:hypothetical protein